MGVAEDHDIGTLGFEVPFESCGWGRNIHDMMHQEFPATEKDHLCFFEGDFRIGIAEHGGYRSNRLELRDQPRHPDVATVKNMIDSLERSQDRLVEVSMRVRNDANLEHVENSAYGRPFAIHASGIVAKRGPMR